MKKTALLFSAFAFLFLAFSFTAAKSVSAAEWGRTGHYITGEIAWAHMTDKTRAEVRRILGGDSIAEAAVWMDQVRRTDEYRHTADWHWVTIPDGMTYEEAEKNPNGDIIEALIRKINALKGRGLDEKRERDAFRMVIHMIGDIHQPLHVGRGDDRGGNDIRVEWMGRSSNLHRVWDTNMIESWELDYETFTNAINHPTPEMVAEWQDSEVIDWARESVSYREQVYDIPDDHRLFWDYRNQYFHIVEKRLLQAGVRMAGVLNDIFDPQ